MNDFTRDLLVCAEEYLQSRKRKITADALAAELHHAVIVWRDNSIDRAARQIARCVPLPRLLQIADKVFWLMVDQGEWYGIEPPFNDEEAILCAAWGIACLRWIHRNNRGYTPKLSYSVPEIEQWMQERQTFQMRLM